MIHFFTPSLFPFHSNLYVSIFLINLFISQLQFPLPPLLLPSSLNLLSPATSTSPLFLLEKGRPPMGINKTGHMSYSHTKHLPIY